MRVLDRKHEAQNSFQFGERHKSAKISENSKQNKFQKMHLNVYFKLTKPIQGKALKIKKKIYFEVKTQC